MDGCAMSTVAEHIAPQLPSSAALSRVPDGRCRERRVSDAWHTSLVLVSPGLPRSPQVRYTALRGLESSRWRLQLERGREVVSEVYPHIKVHDRNSCMRAFPALCATAPASRACVIIMRRSTWGRRMRLSLSSYFMHGELGIKVTG